MLQSNNMANKFLLVVGGPTGVGKTDVAIQLAKHFRTEIVNADSRQVYRELCIGVGRPTKQQLSEVTHHLIGHVPVTASYSAGQFAGEALSLLETLYQHHRIVILCGGTGLYLQAILYGMDAFPTIPDGIVAGWTRAWQEKGLEFLQAELKRLDPVYFGKVDAANPMRLIRALAVSDFTGKPYSAYRTGKKAERDFEIIPIRLDLPREELYRRIDRRVDEMIAHGWLQEADRLYPLRQYKALQTVGYPELFAVIEGRHTLAEAIPLIQQATRRYAKRQLTWFRNQGAWRVFHPADIAAMIDYVLQQIEGPAAPGIRQLA